MAKPANPRKTEEKAKKKRGGQQHPNPPKKTDTNNPERNPRDQKMAVAAASSRFRV